MALSTAVRFHVARTLPGVHARAWQITPAGSSRLRHAHAQPSAQACAQSPADAWSALQEGPAVPPLAIHVVAGCGQVLWVAPSSGRWQAQAPANVSFASAGSPDEMAAHLRRLRPRVVVVGEHAMPPEVLRAWRGACPGEELELRRRGTSMDKIALAECAALGITVANTPGVNARHVASYALDMLDDTRHAPADLRLVGAGNVARAALDIVSRRWPLARATVVARAGRSRDHLLQGHPLDARLKLTDSWDEAFRGARHALVCVAFNDETRGRIDEGQIDSMQPDAAIVCVSKPDVFSDDALRRLAAGGRRLVVDYGPATLAEFRARLERLGLAPAAWRVTPQFTSRAAASEDCLRDLDFAASLGIATAQLPRFVAAQSRRSFCLRELPQALAGRAVSIVGDGINGNAQAFAFLLDGYRVTVRGESGPHAGASHKPVDMRHLSATETAAREVYENRALGMYARRFVEAFNIAGLRLFEKLLQDNPELRRFARAPLVRTFPSGDGDAHRTMSYQRELHRVLMPDVAGDIEEVPAQGLAQEFGVGALDHALVIPGYEVEFRGFRAQLRRMLRDAGVVFRDERVDGLGVTSQGSLEVSARGIEEPGTVPVEGWFVKMPAAGTEGQGLAGLKIHYPLPVGVMNVAMRAGVLNVSGGQVPPGASSERRENIRQEFMRAVQRHFPQSYAEAAAHDALEVISCERPATPSGISLLGRSAQGSVVAGGTFAGGMTQSLALALACASLVTRETGRRAVEAGDSAPVAAVPMPPATMHIAEAQ